MNPQLICPAWIMSLDSRHASHLTSPFRRFTGISHLTCPKLNSWFPHSFRNLNLPLVSLFQQMAFHPLRDPSQKSRSHSWLFPFSHPHVQATSKFSCRLPHLSWSCLPLILFTTTALSERPLPLTCSSLFTGLLSSVLVPSYVWNSYLRSWSFLKK